MSEPVCDRCQRPSRAEGCCPVCPYTRPGRTARHLEQGMACGDCRVLLSALPGEIADAYPLLFGLEVPGAHGGDGRSKNPEAPLPFVVDPLDLTAAWTLPQGPLRRARLAANADLQIGHMPVLATLGTWVRDWIAVRDVGENGPESTVDAACVWLAARTEWACGHHAALDEYADEMVQLRGLLFALVGRPEPDERPERLSGQPCPRCRHVSLTRHFDGRTECGWPDCRTIWTTDEWARVTKATAQAVRRGQIGREDD